jgi:hypothetical protein
MEKIIFDTNAYRYLVKNRSSEQIEDYVNKINGWESANNIQTLISPIVAKELLAHVANKKDPAFDICMKAIKAMYLHNGSDENYRMIASPELLISNAFFKEEIPSKVETNKAIGEMMYRLATDPRDYTFKSLQHNLNLNYNHVMESEKEFAISLKQFVNEVDPNAKGWKIF